MKSPNFVLRQWSKRMSRRSSLGMLAALATAVLIGCIQPVEHGGNATEQAAEKPTGPSVRMTIDFDDGLEKTYTLAWREKMTVLDALTAASVRPRGVTFEQRGAGASAMVTAIDSVANEPPTRHPSRNWLYSVNGKMADKSCGVYELSAADAVLWKFTVYE
jgi:hypothetical protein